MCNCHFICSPFRANDFIFVSVRKYTSFIPTSSFCFCYLLPFDRWLTCIINMMIKGVSSEWKQTFHGSFSCCKWLNRILNAQKTCKFNVFMGQFFSDRVEFIISLKSVLCFSACHCLIKVVCLVCQQETHLTFSLHKHHQISAAQHRYSENKRLQPLPTEGWICESGRTGQTLVLLMFYCLYFTAIWMHRYDLRLCTVQNP